MRENGLTESVGHRDLLAVLCLLQVQKRTWVIRVVQRASKSSGAPFTRRSFSMDDFYNEMKNKRHTEEGETRTDMDLRLRVNSRIPCLVNCILQ